MKFDVNKMTRQRLFIINVTTQARGIALYSLANHLMSATFFHEIRTKQQLGYMVGTGNLPLNRHPGIVLYAVSQSCAH